MKKTNTKVVSLPGEMPVITSDFEATVGGKKIILTGMRDIEAMSATPEWQQFEQDLEQEFKQAGFPPGF